jgi:hypothetical protein
VATTDRGRKLGMALSCALAFGLYAAASTAHGRLSAGISFKQEESGHAIKGFQPKLTATNCLTVRGRDARERLICRTFWSAEGYKMTSISEVIVTRRNGDPRYDFRPLVEARDSTGARGANAVDCGAGDLKLFEIGTLAQGSAPGLVRFDSSHAGRAAVQRACIAQGRNAGLGAKVLDPDEAYVEDRDEETSYFELDIHTRDFDFAGRKTAR